MAIFHYSGQVFSRSDGVSSVAKAAYRSASHLIDERTGQEYDYTRRNEKIQTEIFAPGNSPAWVYDRSKLWNEVEKIEKRKDAQVARELNIALPKELTKEQQMELTREHVKEMFVDKGMIADVCYHFNENNPHVHIMLTMRDISPESFKNKNRSWNDLSLMETWREGWAKSTNKYLELAKKNERIDHRSYERQGINKLPTAHMGVKYHHMEKKGKQTRIGELNRQVKEFNSQKVVELEEYKRLLQEIQQEKQKLSPKRYKAKSENIKIHMNIYRIYKYEFPAVRYFKFNQSKALFNVNSNYGKTVTIKSIYEAYNMLIKFRELNYKIMQELSKLQEANEIIKQINLMKSERTELIKNPLTRFANKSKINALDNEIEKLDNKLYSMGVKQETFAQVKANIEKSKQDIEPRIKELNLIDNARQVVDKAQKDFDRVKARNKNKGQSQNDSRRAKGR